MPDFSSLTPEQLQAYWEMSSPFLLGLLKAVVTLAAGWFASKWANRAVLRGTQRANIDVALARFLSSLAQYAVLAATVLASLEAVGIKTTSLMAIFASAGLAVGLAMQGSLSSFASGVMILFFRPFQLGDRVTVAGETGNVQDIGLFATTLKTLNNHTIIIPNSEVIGGVITNFTREGTIRANIGAGVAYGADLNEVQDALLAACKNCDLVLTEPAPAVAFTEMAASSLNFNVMPWSEASDFLAMQHQVRSNIYDELNARGIDIPFDQIVVHQAPAEA